MTENEAITEKLNELIEKCNKAGGHIYIVDKRQNDFSLRLTTPIKVLAYIPAKREGEDG